MRALAANWLEPMAQPRMQPRFVSKLRHEIAAMPFDPANLVFAQLVLPARGRFGADLGKASAHRGIARPQSTDLRRLQSNIGIESNFEILADFLHHGGRLAHEVFVTDDEARDPPAAHLTGQIGSRSPVIDDVVD